MTDNSFLDPDFTVFAAIPDMTTINNIMALTKVDTTADPAFGADRGNLGFSDVPVEENGFQVFIKRGVCDFRYAGRAKAMAGVQSVMAASAAGFGSASNPAALSSRFGFVARICERAGACELLVGSGGWARCGERAASTRCFAVADRRS